MRGVEVLCGYALELAMSALRGVRIVVGRLVTDGDEDTLRPAPTAGARRARRDRVRAEAGHGSDQAAIRDALAGPAPLPAAYADDRLVLIARDPRTLFAYWDLAPGVEVPGGAADARLVLRLEDLTRLDFDDARAWRTDDVGVERPVGSTYVPLPADAGTFRAEIGWRWRDGRFVARARSGVVTAARDAAPGHDPVRWMTVRRERAFGVNGSDNATAPLAVTRAGVPLGAPVATRATSERPQRRAPASEERPRRGG